MITGGVGEPGLNHAEERVPPELLDQSAYDFIGWQEGAENHDEMATVLSGSSNRTVQRVRYLG
jgi:hypothetical protein